MEIDINKFISEIDFNANKYNDIGNGILLTNREIDILNKYKINYKKCNSLKEILFEVEFIELVGLETLFNLLLSAE